MVANFDFKNAFWLFALLYQPCSCDIRPYTAGGGRARRTKSDSLSSMASSKPGEFCQFSLDRAIPLRLFGFCHRTVTLCRFIAAEFFFIVSDIDQKKNRYHKFSKPRFFSQDFEKYVFLDLLAKRGSDLPRFVSTIDPYYHFMTILACHHKKARPKPGLQLLNTALRQTVL